MSKIRVVAARDTAGDGLIIVGEYAGSLNGTTTFMFPPENEGDAIEAATEIVDAVNDVCGAFGIGAFMLDIMPFSTIKAGKVDDFIGGVVEETYFDAIVEIPGADTAQGWLDKAHAELDQK